MKLEKKIEKIKYFLENVDEKEVDCYKLQQIKTLLQFIKFYTEESTSSHPFFVLWGRKMAQHFADKALFLIWGCLASLKKERQFKLGGLK